MLSTEAAILHAVIEGDDESAREMIKMSLFNGELIELSEQTGRMLDLLNEDIRRRGLRS